LILKKLFEQTHQEDTTPTLNFWVLLAPWRLGG
jgi:hypothetical protein